MNTEDTEVAQVVEVAESGRRYRENPFIVDMVVPVRGQRVQLSPLGRDENILVNQHTGEIQGTHITTYKRVDAEQFVKLFTANIALTFDLNPPGVKALSVLIWAMQHKAISRDEVELDKYTLEEFLEANKLKMSRPTFVRGLQELESSQIIAKTMRRGRYFSNPNFIFNGNRIAFTTLIERKKDAPKGPDAVERERLESLGQQRLDV